MIFSGQDLPQALQPRTSRLIQAGWSLFALLALGLAAAGIASYRQLLALPCTGEACMPGQFTPGQITAVLPGYWSTLAERAQFDTILLLLISLLLAGSAAFFIWRHPAQLALALGGFVFVALAAEPFVSALAWSQPHWSWALRVLTVIHLAGLPLFLSLIPDGRLHPRFLAPAVGICVLLGVLIPLLHGPPLALSTGYSILAVTTVAGAMAARMKDAGDAEQREQLVWLSVSLLLLGAVQIISPPLALLPLPSLPVEAASSFGWLTEWVSSSYLGSVFAAAGAIVCLLIGLLRHEVVQVEIILNRTLIYAILSLFVIGLYIAVVGLLSLIFQSSGSLIFSLIATGLVAVLFQPLRAWAQRFVDRLLYGDRERPYALLAQLGQELESVVAPQDILQQAAERVRVALKLPYTAVALRLAGQEEFRIVAASGVPAPSPLVLPLTVQQEQIGQFVLAPRAAGESFTAADQRFLAQLAGQVAVAAHTVTLMAELQRAREQLVYAREEERLRLRRDLHDGLGTNLAALNLQVGQVRKRINAEPEQADAALLELRTQLRHMIAEVRALINDLRPKSLDEFGFVGALEILVSDVAASSGLRVRSELPLALPGLPAAVEVAAFRIIQESLTNVVKHAAAQNCTIRLTAVGGLRIEVRDDGLGLPQRIAAGQGLSSIRERAFELGGSCSAEALPEGGSRIVVVLPLRTYDDDHSSADLA